MLKMKVKSFISKRDITLNARKQSSTKTLSFFPTSMTGTLKSESVH